MAGRRYILFSELAGTLLDARTFGCEAARPALEALRARGVPLLLMTSKSAEETLEYVRLLETGESFAVENGGAAYQAAHRAAAAPLGAVADGGYYRWDLGVSVERLIAFLQAFNRSRGTSFRTFDDLTTEEVVAATRLTPERAALARRRRFDLPLIVPPREEAALELLSSEAAAAGLVVVGGGMFPHLKGPADKGTAFDLLMSAYAAPGEARTVALGDSANDLPMLERADLAVLMPRPGGSFDPGLRAALPRAILAPRPGPEGWAAAVLDILQQRR